MKSRSNELLLLIFVTMCVWGSYASASRKLLTESDGGGGGGESSTTPNPTTITFFMHQKHHIMEGANPTAIAKPGLGVGGFPTGLQAGIGISGLLSPFGNNFNANGNGPLPLTIPSGAINNSPLFGQLPIPPTTGLGLGLVPNGGLQGLGLGSGSLTPGLGLGLNVPGIINGQLNPQTALLGASGVPRNNVIVIEDTLTEGRDLHSSAVIGKGEGYYYHMPTAEVEDEDEDPNTLLLAFTAKFEGSEYEGSSIEFAGKDNVALPQREIAVVGGTGLFHKAQGHALIESVSHTDDETVLKFTVSLTY